MCVFQCCLSDWMRQTLCLKRFAFRLALFPPITPLLRPLDSTTFVPIPPFFVSPWFEFFPSFAPHYDFGRLFKGNLLPTALLDEGLSRTVGQEGRRPAEGPCGVLHETLRARGLVF